MARERHLIMACGLTLATGCPAENIFHESGSSSSDGTSNGSAPTTTSVTATTEEPTTIDVTTAVTTTDSTSTTDPSDPTVPTGDTGSSESGPTSDPTTTTEGSSSSDDGGSSSEDTGEPANLDDWTQRRQVFIDNANEVDLTDHEIAIDLEIDPEMNGDLSDLRFTAESDSDQLLPHWLETQSPGVSFRAWVRVPFVPAEDVGVIYMWYGNEDAEDVSDPVATFHFWEPFDGDELADLWASNGEYEVANGRLTVTNGSVYTLEPLVDAPGWIVDARMRWPNNDFADAGSGLIMGSLPGVMPGISYVRVHRGSEGFQIDAVVDGMGVPSDGDNPPLPFQATTMEWHRIGNGPDIARGGWTHVPPPPSNNIDMNAVIDEEMYVWFGETGGTGVVNPGDIYDVEIDTMLVRRFEELQPAISRGPEEDV